MKKKISIVLIILAIVGVILVIKNMIIGDIGKKTFEKLIAYEIDNDEKMQIICYSGDMDVTTDYWYNFDFNKKNVVSCSRTVSHQISSPTRYKKYKYKLTNEDIITIKEKLKELNKLEEINAKIKETAKEEKIEELKGIYILADKYIPSGEYNIITNDGQKVFKRYSEVEELIDDIFKIIQN